MSSFRLDEKRTGIPLCRQQTANCRDDRLAIRQRGIRMENPRADKQRLSLVRIGGEKRHHERETTMEGEEEGNRF